MHSMTVYTKYLLLTWIKMARRPDSNKSTEGTVTDNHSRNPYSKYKEEGGIIQRIIQWDCEVSAAISIGGRPRKVSILLFVAVLKFLEVTGHGIPWLLGAFLYACKSTGYTQIFSINVFNALLFDLLIVGIVKVLSRRQRPVYNRDDMFATVSVDKYSFPSGHTTRAVSMALIFMYFDLPRSYTFSIFTWACMIGVSRVILGRHHVLDVVAGIAIGCFEAWVVLLFLWIDKDSLAIILSKIEQWLL